MSNKVRNVCATMNNWAEKIGPEAFEEWIQKVAEETTYFVYGKEVGESGTPHLQMYLEFKSSRSFNAVTKLLKGCHVEPRKGSSVQASEYCKKEKDFEEFGTIKQKPGTRNDLTEIKDRIMTEQACMMDLIQDETIRNYQGLRTAEKLLTYVERERDWKPEIFWYYGKSGVGKSRLAEEQCKGKRTYRANSNGKFWDGYDGHSHVIIDDIRPEWKSWADLLHLLDRYAYKVEVKGGMRSFLATHIYITCPWPPETCFENCGEDIWQLTRRLSEVKEIVEPGAEDRSGGQGVIITPDSF